LLYRKRTRFWSGEILLDWFSGKLTPPDDA